MATFLTPLSSCISRMEPGEKRFAERLKQKLSDDYLIWYDVPFGPNQAHPDFVIFNQVVGILVLEIKSWHPSTIVTASSESWVIRDANEPEKPVANPLSQARQHAHAVVDHLKRDKTLHQTGRYKGQLICPWGFGVVLTNITRKQFDALGLHASITSKLVICQDEIREAVNADELARRLVNMLPYQAREKMNDVQVERMRWMLHEEVRVGEQVNLFGPDDEPPDIMRVFDIAQEQLARSLGEGHRVIHGVAGSGKTMILTYRARYLAQASTGKPILVICFNVKLSAKIRRTLKASGSIDNIEVINFNKWCKRKLTEFKCEQPARGLPDGQYHQEVERLFLQGVEEGLIPPHQYHAVLIDEGHDFKPTWLQALGKMVDPGSNCLLLLYDDCQSIYARERSRQFSFLSVGIQARGRTTVLRVNYRNTRQILRLASVIARDLLSPEDTDEDRVPIVKPISSGREGEEPRVFALPSPKAELAKIVDLMGEAHKEGHAWGDMAVLCRTKSQVEACQDALWNRSFPVLDDMQGDELVDAVAVMTMHSSKGLEFPVVALCGVGTMPCAMADPKDEAKVFYVAATRATHKLFVPIAGTSDFGESLKAYLGPSSSEQREVA